MASNIGSKEAQAYLDPINAPEPSAETGLGTHFGSTFAPASPEKGPTSTVHSPPPANSSGSGNPFRQGSVKVDQRDGTLVHHKPHPTPPNPAPPGEKFPNYREEAFSGYEDAPNRRSHDYTRGGATPPSYRDATSAVNDGAGSSRRRGSSLRERYPGDESHKPLNVIRKDSKRAQHSPHLQKHHLPGADMIDRLDPALGGLAYHHEGPYDAALLARNTIYENSPVAAVSGTNKEALKATPRENIRDALEKHRPLDGTALVAPGVPDSMGRTYNYEEGADLMREGNSDDAGYKRWPGKDYDPEDLGGKAEPAFSLDRALQAHTINDEGIEMLDRPHNDAEYHRKERRGTLDTRDPIEIAGNDAKYADLEHKNYDALADSSNVGGSHRIGALGSIKKRIGSLTRKKRNEDH